MFSVGSGSRSQLLRVRFVETHSFRPFDLCDARFVHDDLHDAEPERTDVLAHNLQPAIPIYSLGFRGAFVMRIHRLMSQLRVSSPSDSDVVLQAAAFFNAWSMSALMSSAFSKPMERRM